MAYFAQQGWKVNIETNPIWVQSGMPVIDRAWTFADFEGHLHTGADLGATTEARYGESYWCDECRDEHPDFLGHFCTQCGEKISPRTTYDPGCWLQGVADATVELDLGDRAETWATRPGVMTALRPGMAVEEVLAVLQADPNSHWISTVSDGRGSAWRSTPE